jgi:hypothetical protein
VNLSGSSVGGEEGLGPAGARVRLAAHGSGEDETGSVLEKMELGTTIKITELGTITIGIKAKDYKQV